MPIFPLRALLLFAGLACSPASGQPVNAPKVVLQSDDSAGAEVAAWYGDDAYLITANGDHRQILIWDVATGHVIDRLRIPATAGGQAEELVLGALAISGRTVTIAAQAYWWDGEDTRRSGREVAFDVIHRAVSIKPVEGNGAVVSAAESDAPAERMSAIQAAGTANLTTGEKAAIAALPPLPASSDGKYSLQRSARGGVQIRDAGGALVRTLYAESQDTTEWVSLDPRGDLLAILTDNKVHIRGTVSSDFVPTADLAALARKSRFPPSADDFGRVGWLDSGRYMASTPSAPLDRTDKSISGMPQPLAIMDAATATAEAFLPPRCFAQPLNARRIVGAGLANCRSAASDDRAVAVLDLADGKWQPIGTAVTANRFVDALRASPDGRRIGLAVSANDTDSELLVVDAATGAALHRLPLPGAGTVSALNFTPDGKSLLFVGDSETLFVWTLGEAAPRALPITVYSPQLILSDGRIALVSGETDQSIQRANLKTGQALPPLEMASATSGGFMPDKSIFWTASTYEGLRLFETRGWTPMVTISRFASDGDVYHLAHAADGRYDTDLPPDSDDFRWLMADAPFQSLAPQTFMRDYFTPDLARVLIACTASNNCNTVLPPIPPVAGLNRSLPVVKIAAIRPAGKALVDIDVELVEGSNSLPSGAYGQTKSGAHNLRMFRNEALIAELGQTEANLDSRDRAAWRSQTRLPLAADGTLKHTFRAVRLPTGASAEPISFSAYAFNEDRVKGETAYRDHSPEPTAPAPRRLFMLSIGINAYPGGTFRPLRYAVPDAEAIRTTIGRLHRAPDDTRPIRVVPISVIGTSETPATRETVRAAFAQLQQATPDDIIVISYSGHGYTDSKGRFSLVPSDVRTVGDVPVRESLITAGDLTAWLSGVDAGDINFIIDACHSAASFTAEGFKPGPMGDPGLGQLAYDKGIRILAASAPDQYAMEESSLGHGLLTYALVVEGINGGKADWNEDGVIAFEELTSYALERLPGLSAPAASDPENGPGLLVEWESRPVARQQPSFFDYTINYSLLRMAVPRPAGGS